MLPIWCGVSAKEVFEYSPRLADKVGLDWALGVEDVCRRLYGSIEKSVILPTKSTWQGS
jgi:hypothetical protein